jgi:glycosyl transferase, family 25
MRSTFEALSVVFERVAAVDAADFTPEESAFHASQCQRPDGGQWTPGKVACYLSHRKVWGMIATRAEPIAAIFEDDVHAAPGLRELLRSSDWIPGDADLVRLETTPMGLRLGRAKILIGLRRVRPVLSRSYGSAGYILTQRAAQRLMDTPVEYYSVDYTLFNQNGSSVSRELHVYQLDPAPLIQDIFTSDLTRKGLRSEIVEWQPAGIVPIGAIRIIARACLGRRVVPFG